jgi:hypothetical protein
MRRPDGSAERDELVINVVWVPWSCDWNEDETEVTLTEQAANPDIGANDPKALGPFRVQHYNAITIELLSQRWTFGGVEWVSPGGTEEEAIAAWEAWEPPLESPEP